MFFPDVCEPRGKTYDAIVKEVEAAGFWAPTVAAAHVPARYTKAAPGTHDELVGAMTAKMGRDPALEFDLVAQVHAIGELAATPDAATELAAHLRTLERSMGAAFAKRYSESVRHKVRGEQARRQAHFKGLRRNKT